MAKTRNSFHADVLTNTNSVIKVPRTTFKSPYRLDTAFNGGKLIPFKVYTCYPGDTLKVDLASLVRVNSPFVKAPMGELEYSCYFFKVPMRILLSDFEEIIANYNPMPDWTTDNTNLLPGIKIPEKSGFAVGSVADYFGFPVNKPSVNSSLKYLNALPLRAYVMIGDQWFRDEDLMNTAGVNIANVDVDGVSSASGDYLTDAILGGALYPVCKLKSGDPYTTMRPGVQKGAPVVIGLAGSIPVGIYDDDDIFVKQQQKLNIDSSGLRELSNTFTYGNGNEWFNLTHITAGSSWHDRAKATGFVMADHFTNDKNYDLRADLGSALLVSVSELRLKFQLEKIKELDALYGNRYPEYLRGRWGVRCADGRLQIPEFLGSQKFVLNINQTVQTSASQEGGTAQSNISAYSLSHNQGYVFETSCTEHCYIIAVGTCRIKHRGYSQGCPDWSLQRAREDFYVPELANISAQPVKNASIYYGGDSHDSETFGFKEAWWQMRMEKSTCTGLMRPDVSGSLAVWHFGDNYSSLPTLSADWIIEDMSALDRCLQIPGETTPHFLATLRFNATFTRPIPLHSYPGLVDHQWGYRS